MASYKCSNFISSHHIYPLPAVWVPVIAQHDKRSITKYGRNAISQNETASLSNSVLFSMSQYGQTETFQNLLHMTLEYKCGSIPGALTFSFIIVPVLEQPWSSLNTPFIIILPAMAAEIWTEIWIQVGSSVCIQALARVLQAGWTPHWSSSVEGRASKKGI